MGRNLEHCNYNCQVSRIFKDTMFPPIDPHL